MDNIKLSLKDSILVMLIKNAEFKEDIEVFKRDEEELTVNDYSNLLQHYTKYYNSIECVSYKFIDSFYIELIGEILFKIDPRLFKRAVYTHKAIAPGTWIETPLLEAMVHEIRVLSMPNIELDTGIKEVLKGEHI